MSEENENLITEIDKKLMDALGKITAARWALSNLEVNSAMYQMLHEIKQYCEPHKASMWAATILGIINGTDFRGEKP